MKNKVKIFLSVILVIVMLLTLVGCGNKEEKVSENPNIDLGKWENDVYTNDYLGFKFTLPTGWEAATDEEIAKMMQLGEDTLANEGKYLSEVAKLSSIYYASATDTNTGSNIIIMSEKATVSLDRYLSTLKTQLQAVTSMSYTVKDEGTAKLGSQDFSTITVAEATYGLEQKYYVHEKDEKFIVVIITSANGENTFNELEKAFN